MKVAMDAVGLSAGRGAPFCPVKPEEVEEIAR